MSDWQPSYSAGLSAPSSPHRPTESMEIQSHWRSSPLHPDNQYGANYYANNKKSKFEYELIPIDHAMSIPDNLEIYPYEICWMDWDQAQAKFSEKTLKYIESIDVLIKR